MIDVCVRDEGPRLPPTKIDRQIGLGELQTAIEVEHRDARSINFTPLQGEGPEKVEGRATHSTGFFVYGSQVHRETSPTRRDRELSRRIQSRRFPGHVELFARYAHIRRGAGAGWRHRPSIYPAA
jgi:hypothetical protein